MGCCGPDAPPGGGKMLGRLQFHGAGVCGDQRPLTFKAGECCLPSGPSDSRWLAAAPGFAPLLAEVDQYAVVKPCCGCASADPFASKTALDGEWTPKANAYLAQHGLVCQIHAFYQYVSTGQGGTAVPMAHLLIYALDDPAAAADMAKNAEESAEAIAKEGAQRADKAPTQQSMR